MADYPIPPWLAPVSPVAPFLQGVSQGASIAEAQNRQALAVAQLQQQEQQDSFRAAQAAIQMQMQQQAAQRNQALQNQQLFGLQLANQQKAADMAATMQQQGAFNRLVGAGVPPEEAFKQSAGMAPFAQAARFYQMQALQQGVQNRQDRAAALRVGVDPTTATPEQIAQATAAKNRPASIRAADEAVNAYVAAKPEATEEEIADLRSRLSRNLKSTEANADAVKRIRTTDEAARSIGAVLENIDKFNQKFGTNAFDEFTGPIDNRILQLKAKYKDKFGADDEEKATQIFSQAADTINRYRNALFGATLTGGEKKAFEDFIAKPDSQKFLTTLKSAQGKLTDDVVRMLENDEMAPNIPTPIKNRYQGRKVGDWFMGGTQANSGPVAVKSQAEYEKLPSGSLYVDDSGKIKRKK